MNKDDSLPGWPSVSVIIPVRNEPDAVFRAVASARAQAYPGYLEIVVADGSDLSPCPEWDDPNVIVVANSKRVTPAGLNRAINASSGDVIVRLDAHAELPAGYVARAVDLLQATGADNVGGVQRAVGITPMQRAIALAMSSPIGVGDARFHYGGRPGPVDTVYLGNYRRDVFDRLGGFDERLVRNQDYEMNIRIRSAGGLVYFHPDLVVDYRPRSSLIALWRQYFDYGRWKRRVVSRHPRTVRMRQLAPPALVIGLLGSGAAAAAGRSQLAAIVPGLWFAALAAGAMATGWKHSSWAALGVPLAAGTMHLAWGTGFLFGRLPHGARSE